MAHVTTYDEMLCMLKKIQELKNGVPELDGMYWEIDRLVDNAKERKKRK